MKAFTALVSSTFFSTYAPTTDNYTLSLHDALPISLGRQEPRERLGGRRSGGLLHRAGGDGLGGRGARSEEHTSELQSRLHIVCRLLLEKKNSILADPSTSTKLPPNLVPALPLVPQA